jgi:hypothetical protein
MGDGGRAHAEDEERDREDGVDAEHRELEGVQREPGEGASPRPPSPAACVQRLRRGMLRHCICGRGTLCALSGAGSGG